MKFIGHLDVMRFFQKVMRRADIPIAFSGGYSPHMIMSFAQPLGIGLTSDGEYLEMKREKTSGSFDYYTAQIVMGKDLVRYYFEIHSGLVTCYYDTNGVSTRHEERTEFEIYPGYHVPEWLKGAVMYQIYVDRFCNGDPSNDVETGEYFYIGDTSVKVDNWEKVPAVMGVREFYGGDLQGVMDKLDYLQELGVDVIYPVSYTHLTLPTNSLV